MSRLEARGATSCQYALFMLRWLDRPPEDFLTVPYVDVGDAHLPAAGPGQRLRWNLGELHAALNDARQLRTLTWTRLAEELGCTASRLTGLRTATFADMELAMRVTQWLGRPAAAFIHPEQW
jgi:hypothetical protein